MKITFDSNVWEYIVISDNNNNDDFWKLKQLILSKKIQAFICEIAISLESIRKNERANIWKSYEPSIKFKSLGTSKNEDGVTMFHNSICFSPDTEKHPSLHPTLINRLELAKKLGFKVLCMTNFGTIRTSEIPKSMKIKFKDTKAYWDYAGRASRCGKYILELKAGQNDYNVFKEKYNIKGGNVSRAMFEIPETEEKKFSSAIAEWSDGDSIGAHYAFMNDVFCTLDSAKNSGEKSVFSAKNRAKLKEDLGINILSIEQILKMNI